MGAWGDRPPPHTRKIGLFSPSLSPLFWPKNATFVIFMQFLAILSKLSPPPPTVDPFWETLKTILFLCKICFTLLVCWALYISANKICPVDRGVVGFRKWLPQFSLTHDFITFSSDQALGWKTTLTVFSLHWFVNLVLERW